MLERKAPSSALSVVHKQVSELYLWDLTQIDPSEHFNGWTKKLGDENYGNKRKKRNEQQPRGDSKDKQPWPRWT